MASVRLIACALMVMAFVPHHHADDLSGTPCSLCVSQQNSAASHTADTPSVSQPSVPTYVATDGIGTPASAAVAAPRNPRAPPF